MRTAVLYFPNLCLSSIPYTTPLSSPAISERSVPALIHRNKYLPKDTAAGKDTLQSQKNYVTMVSLLGRGEIMALQESGEMYLETIYVLGKANPQVRSIDISEHMGYSKPSVSRAVHLLQEQGYIGISEDGLITLTPQGQAIAEKIFERHTLISTMLIRLGVDPAVAAEDACRMEHAISDESFQAIKRHINGQ